MSVTSVGSPARENEIVIVLADKMEAFDAEYVSERSAPAKALWAGRGRFMATATSLPNVENACSHHTLTALSPIAIVNPARERPAAKWPTKSAADSATGWQKASSPNERNAMPVPASPKDRTGRSDLVRLSAKMATATIGTPAITTKVKQ